LIHASDVTACRIVPDVVDAAFKLNEQLRYGTPLIVGRSVQC